MQTIFLFRHAAPEQDFALRYLGRTDPALSDDGRRQARTMFAHVTELPELPVRASPLRRAQETARCGFDRDIPTDVLLTEFSFGTLDGLLPDEAARLYPEAHRYLTAHPLDAGPFGGDDWPSLLGRADAFARRLGGESCVVVGHRIALHALVHALGARSAVGGTLALRYGEGCTLRRCGAGWERGDGP
ncbi:histidine phosphatase family protein [Streptomyces sp. NPDC057424]|uniref:histidine phosphatase family protein n=1 Tax=Streptomyces sp. NPDC057424 TaxID=3346127 RepID=UPI0036A1C54C